MCKSFTLTNFDLVSLTTLFTSMMTGMARTHVIEVAGVSFEAASTSTPAARSDLTDHGAISVVPTEAGGATPVSLDPALPGVPLVHH